MSSPDFPRQKDHLEFPKVEGKKKKPLYHCGLISDMGVQAAFRARGWEPVDLRLAESGPETLKQWLEGIRFGTIEADRQTEKFVELELKVYGLLNNKKSDVVPTKEAFSLDTLKVQKKYSGPKKTKSKED